MNTAALLLIVIGMQATTIETPNMQQCVELQQFAESELKGKVKKDEYLTQCFIKIGGANRGS